MLLTILIALIDWIAEQIWKEKTAAMPTQIVTPSPNFDQWHPPEWDLILSAARNNRPMDIWNLVKGPTKVAPNHSNAAGQTALHIAALWGHVDCVALLVSADVGANPNAQNKITGAAPLHMAIQSKKITEGTRLNLVIDVLLEAGADKTLADAFGHLPVDCISNETPSRETVWNKLHVIVPPPPMFEAILQGDFTRMIELFYAAKKSPHELACQMYRERTTVQAIVDVMVTCVVDAFAPAEVWMEADLHALQILLTCGAPTNAAFVGDKGKWNEYNPDEDEVGDQWKIPNTAPVLNRYIENNKISSEEEQQSSSLHLPPIVRLWLEACQAVDDRHQLNTKSLSKILYIKPAPLLTKDEISKYWHNAARRGHLLMLQALHEYLPNFFGVNCENRQGMTALHFAARSGRTEVLRFLLSLPNVDIWKQDALGKTALDAATVNGHTAAIELLRAEQ
ncbi:MAG: hypothetical protein SGARI_004386 [Bacillariaceae sp.]